MIHSIGQQGKISAYYELSASMVSRESSHAQAQAKIY